MDPAHWQRLSEALDRLLDMAPPARTAALAQLRQQDAAFADELVALLAADDAQASLLDTPLVTAPPGPREGELVGPYRLEKLLGEGGMGQVWMAARADGLYQRQVALKLLRPGFADPDLRLRFSRERQILARLAHPHIARLLDAGISAAGQPYLALEHVEGMGLLEYCRQQSLPLRRRLQLFQQVCQAVSHAHANLVVHRDLKPSNILVSAEGDVRLLDFGIAKLLDGSADEVPEYTRTGTRSFTLHYAAPEQILGEPVSTRTDVYALGVILYELLTGTRPYRPKRESGAQWEEAILAADPQRPSQALLRDVTEMVVSSGERRRQARLLAGDLDNIVLKALAKRPDERYPSAEALSLDIQRYLDGLPVLARPQSIHYRVQKFLHRHRWPIVLGGTAAAVLLALLALSWQQRQQAVRETARAQALQDFVVDLFENAGGIAAHGKPVDVETLVNEGQARGERELAQQPLAHAELLGVIARIRIALGEYEKADELLSQQAKLLAQMPQPPAALQLEATIQRGHLQRLQGDAEACVATLQPAFAEARNVQARLPAMVADYYSHLARCKRMQGEREMARRLFEQSLTLRRSVLADDIGVVENLTDLAALSVDIGDDAAAQQGFRGALAQLQRIAGPRHPLAIDILKALADNQAKMGQVQTALQQYAQALELSDELQGPTHPATLALRQRYGLLLLASGQIKAARGELQANHPAIIQRHGNNSLELAASWDALGQVAQQAGQTDAAHAAYQRAQRLQKRYKAESERLVTLQHNVRTLLEADRAQAALLLLNDADAGDAADAGTREALELLRVEAHRQLGQYAQAQSVLDGMGDSPDRQLAAVALALARESGDSAALQQTLTAVLAQPVLDAHGLQRHVRAQMLQAEVACRQDTQQGQAQWQALLQRLQELYPEGAPALRMAEQRMANCARVPQANSASHSRGLR